ncbi:hypothetical protein [Goodfellowiella coeruleoviolacea]|uniref:hypothetical protein n=1 Tax=Goodfellowiella coeruleoviolacea TaxID=334858 RepID=UPI0020A5177B|nr:hypothetical protein [Goodfellowiella coeruleoviolacea]
MAVIVVAAPVLSGASATAWAAQPPEPTEQCRVTDKRLDELSGLASDGQHRYAVNDGGSSVRVFVLDRNCAVQRVINNPTDPYDVEDLARTADGTLWLADTGDNEKKRDTVALHALTPRGTSTLYRLVYPDGPHDSEALLVDRSGTPYLVTKNVLGAAEVYRPASPLTSPGPTPLERVASVSIRSTDTPGGPVAGVVGSVLVTGGAVSADGTVVALRTYTDAYLFSAPDGDVVAALGRTPVRIPLANEPQGEAIAFDPDGTLLSGSEGVGQPVRAVPGATALAAGADQSGADQSGAEQTGAGQAEPERSATAGTRPGSSADQAGQPGADTGTTAQANEPDEASRTLPTIAVAAVVVVGLLVALGRRRRRG